MYLVTCNTVQNNPTATLPGGGGRSPLSNKTTYITEDRAKL